MPVIFKSSSQLRKQWSALRQSPPAPSLHWCLVVTPLISAWKGLVWLHWREAWAIWYGRRKARFWGLFDNYLSLKKNPALCCGPRWGGKGGSGEECRLWKAIYLLTPYAMFSKLSSLWEEEEDEERPLLVDDLVTKGSCEVIWLGYWWGERTAHGFCD